jgi:hypothetical protein
MVRIFIDTNIFLGLYQSNHDSLKIFGDINKIKSNLIMPDQIYDEFVRNRDVLLKTLIDRVSSKFQINLCSTSLISHTKNFPKFGQIKKEFDENKEALIIELKEILIKPNNDPIYDLFIKLFHDKDVMRIKSDKPSIERAHQRSLIGNPPTSQGKGTICDELIWELLLDHTKDDLVVISRDKTYENHTTFLSQEFHRRTNKNLIIEKKVSEGLKLIGKRASKDLIEFEKEPRYIGLLGSIPLNINFSGLGGYGLGAALAEAMKDLPPGTLGGFGLGAALAEAMKDLPPETFKSLGELGISSSLAAKMKDPKEHFSSSSAIERPDPVRERLSRERRLSRRKNRNHNHSV